MTTNDPIIACAYAGCGFRMRRSALIAALRLAECPNPENLPTPYFCSHNHKILFAVMNPDEEVDLFPSPPS